MPEPRNPDRVAWEQAPATSHLWGWRYLDIRVYDTSQYESQVGTASVLLVRFRDPKTGGYTSEYAYGYAHGDEGGAILESLRAAAHPYSGVLLPKVIRAGVIGKRVA